MGRLRHISELDDRLVVGLMSGTSADGVDAVLAELRGHGRGMRFRIIGKHLRPYPSELRRAVLRYLETGDAKSTCVLNFAIAREFASAVNELLGGLGIDRREVHLVASHGQTVYHAPRCASVNGIRERCTLQLGSVAVIAEYTGVLTVGDFRVRDVAAGGEGAPIIAYVDYALLSHPRRGRAVQNIGGIANVTVLPPNPRLGDVYAFDTGPGNMMIDEAVRILTRGELQYDVDGGLASRGTVDEQLLEKLMQHPFVRAPPPKTTGREEFGRHFTQRVVEEGLRRGLRPEDIVATLTAFTVKSIVYNYDRYVLPRVRIEEVVVGGGGVRNRVLMEMLRQELRQRGIRLVTHEELGIDSKFKEALGMAVLGHEALSGVPNNVPGATGAGRRVVMGVFAL